MNFFTSCLLLSCLLFLLLSSTSTSTVYSSISNYSSISSFNGGFTVDLFHRESPNSPSYDPTKTPFERLWASIHRSTSKLSPPGFVAPATPAGGEYLMRIAIGTPPAVQFAIADTRSDLSWFQCLPCKPCYQRRLQPVVDVLRHERQRRAGIDYYVPLGISLDPLLSDVESLESKARPNHFNVV